MDPQPAHIPPPPVLPPLPTQPRGRLFPIWLVPLLAVLVGMFVCGLLTMAGVLAPSRDTRPSANVESNYPDTRIWGTGNTVARNMPLRGGTYRTFWEANNGAANNTCPITATLSSTDGSSPIVLTDTALTDNSKPRIDLPDMTEGQGFLATTGKYDVVIDTKCEWLIILSYQP